jgi:Ca2+-binding EF-hand superfamily protein
MLPALAALSGLDALQSLFSSKSSSTQSTGFSQTINDPFDLSGTTSQGGTAQAGIGSPSYQQISPQTMSALIQAQSQSGTQASTSSTSTTKDPLQDLFSLIDGNGDGQISKSEFENALGAGGTNVAAADKVFGELDKNGDGSVSLDEMKSALQGAGGHHGGHHHHVASSDGSDSSSSSGSNSSDPLAQALAGASSTSVTNADGSTTTQLTFADGTKVSMTAPAAKSASASATSSYNLIEQLIQREAQAVSSNASSSVALSA